MKPKFSTLILLTVITIFLLIPFVISPWYFEILQENFFELQLVLKGEVYKQITGYLSLLFVLFEIFLTARKRGRGWKIKITLPGSMLFWRVLHIFLGIGLLGTTLIHTLGNQGLNYNAVFLWVFFAVTLSALLGVLTETGIVESPRKFFGWIPAKSQVMNDAGVIEPSKLASYPFVISKGPLIRNLRKVWLNTHIFLVSIFCTMLVCHIFLAYYYQ